MLISCFTAIEKAKRRFHWQIDYPSRMGKKTIVIGASPRPVRLIKIFIFAFIDSETLLFSEDLQS